MDANVLHDIIPAGVSVIAAVVSTTAVLLPFLWTNFRRKGRLTDALDFAKKRTDFWSQYLQVGMCATLPNTDEQKQLRLKVLFEISEIASDTENELKRLSWSDRIRAQMSLTRFFKDPFPSDAGIATKIAWWFFFLVALLCMFMYWLFVLILEASAIHPPKSLYPITLLFVTAMLPVGAILYRKAVFYAYLVKWPMPKRRFALNNPGNGFGASTNFTAQNAQTTMQANEASAVLPN